MTRETRNLCLLSVAALVIMLVLLFVLDVANLRVVTGIYMWIGLALSWNIIGGYTGYLSFGHAAFFGVGAYATAILMSTLGWPFPLAVLAGGVCGAVLAVLIGIPTLRLAGAYFAIATWAVALCLLQLANVLEITGGAYGISLPSLYGDVVFNVVMFVLAWITFFVTWRYIEHGSFGRKLEALRENEVAAEMLGIDTNRQKLIAFILSAFFPALIGGVYAEWIVFIEPNAVFGNNINDPMVLMTILGGLGTVFGPIVAAVVLYLLDRILWINWSASTAYLIVIGLLTCIVVLYAPEGLVGTLKSRAARRRRGPDRDADEEGESP